MRKRTKIILVVIAAMLLCGLGIGAKFMLDVQAYQNEMAAMEIGELNLSGVPDGTYEGSYDADLIKVQVAVTVEDQRIIDIALLEHENGKGAPAEAVIPHVIESQSLDVEAVSGATNSSKVILKAIETAVAAGK